MPTRARRSCFNFWLGSAFKTSIILNPAVPTAKYAKYAKEERVERIRTFSRWVFAWFAFFAVISSETKIYFETPHVVSYFINGRLADREFQQKGGALSRAGIHLDSAAVGFDHPGHDGQAQTGALGFGCCQQGME